MPKLELLIPEDALWTMIRIAPASLPQGEFLMIPGAVYARLPNVVGKTNPADLVREKTPLAGIVPVAGPGCVLHKEMADLIHPNGGSLVPVWSGDVGKTSHNRALQRRAAAGAHLGLVALPLDGRRGSRRDRGIS